MQVEHSSPSFRMGSCKGIGIERGGPVGIEEVAQDRQVKEKDHQDH